MPDEFIILECQQPDCLFRFPIKSSTELPPHCPRCGGPILIVRQYTEGRNNDNLPPSYSQHNLYLILDNIRSTYNVGSILRTADGFGINHIYHCGITSTPDNPKIKKTGLGAEWSIPWTYSTNSIAVARELKIKNNLLLGLEVGSDCEPIFNLCENKSNDIVIILGNEIAGLDPGIRELCDHLFYIPMSGYKRSFNVTIAFGIACFYLRYMK